MTPAAPALMPCIDRVVWGSTPSDLPASARATERTAILRGPSTPPVCRDHLDAVLGHQTFVEGIAVVGAVADQSRREVREEAGVEGGGDEVRLIR